MKTTLLAVLLLLPVTGVSSNYAYGDIIAFQRPGYMHFGVYIDRLRFADFGQKETDNLFHITVSATRAGLSDCKFGTVAEETKTTVKVFNYLDTHTDVPRMRSRSEDSITERIVCKLHNCQLWDPLSDNCEHLSTYIRYGIPISLQLDNSMEGKCHNRRYGLKKEEEDQIIKWYHEYVNAHPEPGA